MTTHTAKRSSRRLSSPVETVTSGRATRVLQNLGLDVNPSNLNLARTLLDVLVRACQKLENQKTA